VLRRDRLWREDGKPDFRALARDQFLSAAAAELEAIQRELFAEAKARRDANIHRGIASLDELARFYAEEQRYPGWVELGWSRPTGAELDEVVNRLKALKLTIRNTPTNGEPVSGCCPFTGRPAVERILVARAY
jgi:prolyl-tRNA synthetase